jgi:hypothetical protein
LTERKPNAQQVSCAIADLLLIGYFVFAQNVFILLHVDASSCGNCARHQNVVRQLKKTTKEKLRKTLFLFLETIVIFVMFNNNYIE